MQTITIAGHKGGLGKTTLAILLAQMANLKKKRVALIDLDPQQSLSEWWAGRPEDDPLQVVALAHHEELEKAKELLAPEHDFLFVDTPPAHQDIIKTAIASADMVIVPCSPSPMDIKGIGETITVLESLRKPFFFVINRAISRTNIAAESLPLLAQHGKVAPNPIGMRVDYAQGMIGGGTPLDVGNKNVEKEISELYSYLTGQLEKL
jgi:chromosome partitioning protein